MIAIDFETYLIDKDNPFPKPVCLSYRDSLGNKDVLVGSDMFHFLDNALDKRIVAQNATFECGVIYYHFKELRGKLFKALRERRIHCTKIREQLLDCSRKQMSFKYSLDGMVLNYFNEDISAEKKDPDAWRLRYSELDGVPLKEWPKRAYEYSLDDSIWAYKVYKAQGEVYDADSVTAEVSLNLMGAFGMKIDSSRVLQLESEIYVKLEPKYKKLIDSGFCSKVAGTKRPKKNMKELRQYISNKIKSPMYTPKGTIRTDNEALNIYSKEDKSGLFEDFLHIGEYDKVLTAYISRLKTVTDVIRTRYSAVKVTGRTSSSSDRNYPSVNIQQMPRSVSGVSWDIRNCFVPREGYKLVSIDYSGLELVSTAYQLYTVFGRSKMRDTLNEGDSPTDMHSKLACQLMSIKEGRKVSYEEFVANKKEKKYAEYRQLSKPINLGFPGGIGYDTMRYLLLMSGVRTKFEVLHKDPSRQVIWSLYVKLKKECEDLRVARINKKEYALVIDELVGIKKALFRLYPELGEFLQKYHHRYEIGEIIRKKNEYDEWEDEPMYKYKVGSFERNWCNYTAMCNGFLMQTPSAIGAKNMVSEFVLQYMEHPEVNPLAFIHDEVLFEVKDNENQYKHTQDIAELMIDMMQKQFPKIRVTVEADIMDYWSKSGGDWSRVFWKDYNSKELRHE